MLFKVIPIKKALNDFEHPRLEKDFLYLFFCGLVCGTYPLKRY